MSLMLLKSKAKKKSLLDAYKNNLVMGFSYYKLLSSYDGYCVKVRRSSDNATQDFGFVKKKYVNLAPSATLTYSETMGDTTFITDNILGSFTTHSGTGARWIKFDLGTSYNISNINFWHYYADGRTYHDVIIQISIDNINWTNLFNNDSDNSANQGIGTDVEYVETLTGKKLTINQNARYVRLWTNGSNSNTDGHYVEVEILTYTNEWYIDVDSILAFCGSGNGQIDTYYNQYVGGNNAIQSFTSGQPLIVSNGLFKWDGLYFDALNDVMPIVEYDAANILHPPISIYVNGFIASSANQFPVIKGNASNAVQYAMYSNSGQISSYMCVNNGYNSMWSNITFDSLYKRLYSHNGVLAKGYTNGLYGTKEFIISNYTERTGLSIGGFTSYLQKGPLKTVIVLNKDVISEREYNIFSKY